MMAEEEVLDMLIDIQLFSGRGQRYKEGKQHVQNLFTIRQTGVGTKELNCPA